MALMSVPPMYMKASFVSVHYLIMCACIETTYIQKSTDAIQYEGKTKTIITFKETYSRLKLRKICKIINKPDAGIHQVTFQGQKLRKWTHSNREKLEDQDNTGYTKLSMNYEI
jgi:hypothetical protein